MNTIAINVPLELAEVVQRHVELHGEALRNQSSCKCRVETTYQKGRLQAIHDTRERFGQPARV